MKLKTLTMLALACSCSLAFAIEGVVKDNAKLPFHKKIDSTASDKQQLENQMHSLYGKTDNEILPPAAEEARQQEKIVSDFIDVEVHWGGKDEKVVDRRMNSVGGFTLKLIEN